MWVIPEQNNSAPVHVLLPRMRFLDPPAPPGYWDNVTIEGRWIYLSEKETKQNLTGTIVCYALQNGETQEKAAEYFTSKGIAALVTLFRAGGNFPGAGNWVRERKRPNQPFPLYEMTGKQNNSMEGWFKNQTRGVYVRITYDRNPWDTSYAIGIPIVGISILVFSGGICILAVWKLTLLILLNGFRVNMAQITLWINVFGCLLRMLFGATDPFASFETTTFTTSQVLLTISFPSVLSGCLLISLYWHEMIQRTGNKVYPFLSRLQIPFFIASAVMLVFEVVTSVVRSLHYSFSIIQFIDGAIYIVASVAVFSFFVVTRTRLQRIFNKVNKSLSNRRTERLTLATTQITTMIVFMVFFIIILVLIGASDLVWSPISFPVLWALMFLTGQVISLCQVLLIRAPVVTLKWFFCGILRPDSVTKPSFENTNHTGSVSPTRGMSAASGGSASLREGQSYGSSEV